MRVSGMSKKEFLVGVLRKTRNFLDWYAPVLLGLFLLGVGLWSLLRLPNSKWYSVRFTFAGIVILILLGPFYIKEFVQDRARSRERQRWR